MTVRGVARGMAFRRMMRAGRGMLVGGAVDADAPKRRRAEKAGNQRAEQRQEDDEDEDAVHARGQPFIRLMSSTAMVPRLR